MSAMWKKTFNLDGLRRRRRFGNQIDTDGVSLVTHFNVKVRARTKHKKRRRYKQRKQQGGSSSTRIIAIDPGRNNLVMAFDSATSSTRKLTRKTYYQRAGINKATRKIANCELPLHGVNSKLSKASIRTSSARLSYEYRQTIIKNYDRLWKHRTERKRSKIALTVFAGKQRALDKFFVDLKTMGGVSKDDKRSIVIAYGAATMNPTGKGETSVPVKRVLKVCQRYYSTVMVNEHLTTKVHNVCHQRLNPVSRMSERFPIRGLCWCQTCSKYVSRDGNAAQNILRVYRAKINGKRPHDLRFGQAQQKMQTLAKVPIPQKTNKLWRELLSF
jgi:transposase